MRKHQQKNRQNAVQIEVQNLVAFKSPQSLGKAKKKIVKFLPNSPRKRNAVIATVAGLGTLKSRRLDNNPRIHSVDKEVVDKVANFYLTTSWICLGERDVVIVIINLVKKRPISRSSIF